MNDDYLIDSRQLRELVGGPDNPASEMWVWRAVKRGTIPEPQKLNGRNYWRKSDALQALGLAQGAA